MLRDGASPSRTTSLTATVTGGVTGGSADTKSTDEKPSGISSSEGGDSSFDKAAAFPFFRLRCLYARARSAGVLARFGRG